MQAHGASAAGEVFWATAIGIGLYMGLTLKAGAITQEGTRPISTRSRPLLYWTVQAGLAIVVVVLLVIGWQVSTNHPVTIRSGEVTNPPLRLVLDTHDLATLGPCSMGELSATSRQLLALRRSQQTPV